MAVEFPDESLGDRAEEQARHVAREAFYDRPYEPGYTSSGHAGAALGLPRSAFLDVLGTYGASPCDPAVELAEDARSASSYRGLYYDSMRHVG
jgi:hypothetical protein